MKPMKVLLDENEMPTKWYNIVADLPSPLYPEINPFTKKPVTADDMKPVFPMGLIMQEVAQDRWIPIPEEVLEAYKLWRPTPLIRARRLEQKLNTPAKIYYKWEGVSPPGSHKPNTAVPQAYYNMKEGAERLTTETGAGQWGSALSFATSLFGLECVVYMVKVSYHQKPYRRILMETWGAKIHASPSNLTNYGRKVLKEDPENPGSLGIAISEAIEDAVTSQKTKYSIGSVVNFVLMHQTIIGLEAQAQFKKIGEYPDILFGCVGGGSNFAGASFPFIGEMLRGGRKVESISCEPQACPTLTKGVYAFDYGDTAQMAPILKMYTLGHDFMPAPIHAGGLRYHGDAPILCKLTKDGYMGAKAFHQREVFEAAVLFARTEGIVVAPETAHAVKGVIDEALRCKQSGEAKTIYFSNSGHGHFDLSAYDQYLTGKMVDYEYPEAMIKKSLEKLPKVDL